MISVVGDDFPESYMQLLKDHSIDLEGLQIKEGEKSFFWSGKYHNDMNSRDTLVTELNVLENFEKLQWFAGSNLIVADARTEGIHVSYLPLIDGQGRRSVGISTGSFSQGIWGFGFL